MTKKEIIWRYILEEALSKRILRFTQKDIAKQFHFSTSTVFNALRAPRKIGAIKVTGRFFQLMDAEKLLLLWATNRNLNHDILYATHVDASPLELEGSMPPQVIFGAFSAYRLVYNEIPADYSLVYVYSENIDEIKKRFPEQKKKNINLFVLKPDKYLKSSGKTTPNSQTFVDLWNLQEWYAKDFSEALKQKMKL